ncbi:hypothetical protein HYW54_04060 [Candidatus Gottesmanbacteria bacterium]|nr:hypothetical protein [Candidatus Gottesmanbacteria bacterium]
MKISVFWKNEFFLIVGVILISIFIGFLPILYHSLGTPSGKIYTMAFNFYPDYYQFLSWMKDGSEGQIALTSRFTPEIFPRKYGHTFFSILGFTLGSLGFNPMVSFTFSRFIFGFIRLLLVYILIIKLVQGRWRRLISFLSVVLMSSFLRFNWTGDVTTSFGNFLWGITNFDVLRRIAFLPHHTASSILMIGFLFCAYKGIKDHEFKYSLIGSVLLFFSVLINPATLAGMIFILPLAFFLIFFQERKFFYLSSHFVLYLLPLVISVYYYRFYLFTVFPWDNFLRNDIATLRWPFWEYIMVLGPALPLAITVLVLTWRKRQGILYYFIVGWAFGPVIGVFASQFIPEISMFRLLQLSQFIPLSILGSMGIFIVYDNLRKKFITILLTMFLVVLFILNCYLSLKTQFEETNAFNLFSHIPVDTLSLFTYLDNNTPPESVVLAGYSSGIMLPSFAHNRVLVGHGDATFNYNEKLDIMTKFYSNTFSSDELVDIIRKYKIKYIYFGPDTPRPWETSVDKLPNKKVIYNSGLNVLYEVLD